MGWADGEPFASTSIPPGNLVAELNSGQSVYLGEVVGNKQQYVLGIFTTWKLAEDAGETYFDKMKYSKKDYMYIVSPFILNRVYL